MKFKLSIKPQEPEFVQAQVHQKDAFVDRLEKFVISNGNSNQTIAYDDKDLIFLSLDQVVCFTIIQDKIYAIDSNNKQYISRKRIYQLVHQLPDNFWRINKSAIVNRLFIERFEETPTAGVNIIMKNGYKDYVSRRCFSKIRKELRKS